MWFWDITGNIIGFIIIVVLALVVIGIIYNFAKSGKISPEEQSDEMLEYNKKYQKESTKKWVDNIDDDALIRLFKQGEINRITEPLDDDERLDIAKRIVSILSIDEIAYEWNNIDPEIQMKISTSMSNKKSEELSKKLDALD